MKEIQVPPNNSSKKTFGLDVGKLVSGTSIAMIVGICLTPIITRIYTPDIYGISSVFLSIVSIITVVACLRYEFAIPLPKDDEDAGALLLACILILISVSLLCIPFFILFGDFIAKLIGNTAVQDYFLLIPIAVFIRGLYNALRYWNTRCMRFGTQATTQVLQSVSSEGLKLGFGFVGYVNPGSLIVGNIIGQGLGMLILLRKTIECDFALIRSILSWNNIFNQMLRYKKFPIYNIWGALMNTISWQIPVFMMTALFSSTVTGLYALGMYLIQAPMSLIGKSISQVFLQRGSLAKHSNTLSDLAMDTCSILIILSVLPFALLSIISGDIFGIIFGSEWVEAGVYVQILGPWAMVWFVTSPLTTIAIVVEKQEINLIYNIIILITRVGSMIIGGIYGSVYLALFLFMVSGVIVYGGIGYLCVVKWAKASVKDIWNLVKQPVIISVFLALFVLILSYIQISSLVLCAISVLFCFAYIFYIFKTQSLVRAYIGK